MSLPSQYSTRTPGVVSKSSSQSLPSQDLSCYTARQRPGVPHLARCCVPPDQIEANLDNRQQLQFRYRRFASDSTAQPVQQASLIACLRQLKTVCKGSSAAIGTRVHSSLGFYFLLAPRAGRKHSRGLVRSTSWKLIYLQARCGDKRSILSHGRSHGQVDESTEDGSSVNAERESQFI